MVGMILSSIFYMKNLRDIGVGMCCNEHGVLCKTDESPNSASETNNTIFN